MEEGENKISKQFSKYFTAAQKHGLHVNTTDEIQMYWRCTIGDRCHVYHRRIKERTDLGVTRSRCNEKIMVENN